jgi:aminopeptidase N
MKKSLFIIKLLILSALPSLGQRYVFTRDDTLRGSITPQRAWWDLTFYHLKVRLHLSDSSLTGSTRVVYRVLRPAQELQIDLQRPLRVLRVEQEGQRLRFRQDGNAYFVTLKKRQQAGRTEALTVFYEGKPRKARKPPWDGGVVWARDSAGAPFVATACQGLGASAWWPCKDHPYDEPDSMAISVTVPDGLTDVSNGRLRRVTAGEDGTRTFDWAVRNPINNYGVNLNVAHFRHWSDTLNGEKGPLTLDFYVLPEHENKARSQFTQAKKMLRAFEYWFGPYPFYEDGYKLVEAPYLGMEHQSSVTYGNGFRNGYLGKDLSATGWGLKWDFIIVHESGHEWFANSLTNRDAADMWIHESFTNYAECLFTEYYYGKAAGAAYVIGTRKLIRNDRPIVGTYNVNHPGSGDMYYKGGNLLHTLRQLVPDDARWRAILRSLNQTFFHQTITGRQVERYLSQQIGRDLSRVFDQYLRDVRVPTLEYEVAGDAFRYRWTNCVPGFDLPLRVCLGETGVCRSVQPTTEWQTLPNEGTQTLTSDPNYYVAVKKK